MISLQSLANPRRLGLLALDLLLLGLLLGWIVTPPHAQKPAARAIDLSVLLADRLNPPSGSGASLGDTYALLIGQPLFQQDRKYTPPPRVDVSVKQTPPPDLVVTGYLEIPGRPAKALLRERSGTRSLTVTIGDAVDGWSVVGLAPKQVSLREGERTATLNRGGAPVVGIASGTDAAVPAAGPIVPRSANAAPPQPLMSDQPRALELNQAGSTANSAMASPASPAKATLSANLAQVTVSAPRPVRRPPLLPAPLGPPQTFSAPPRN